MRSTAKYLPLLILGTALTGCSMAGTGDFFADEYADLQRQQMPHYFGAPAAKSQHPVTPDAQAYGTSVRGHQEKPGHQGQRGHHATGQHANYVPSSYGAAPHELRGGPVPFKPHTYGTVGVVNYEAGEDLYGVQSRFGYQANKYLGAEVEGSFGLSKDSSDLVVGGAPFRQSISVENSLAAFGVLRLPLFSKFSGYGRVGYHQTELDEKVSSASAVILDREYSTNGVAYGTGLEYAVNPRTAVRLDYTVYDFDGPNSDAVSLAVSRKF